MLYLHVSLHVSRSHSSRFPTSCSLLPCLQKVGATVVATSATSAAAITIATAKWAATATASATTTACTTATTTAANTASTAATTGVAMVPIATASLCTGLQSVQ